MTAKRKARDRTQTPGTRSRVTWIVVLAIAAVAVGALALRGPATGPTKPELKEKGEPVNEASRVTWYGYEVVNAYPHDTAAFTQGLVWRNGRLYEGTGQLGASSIRRVELETGKVELKLDIDPNVFGEGVTIWDGSIFQLTWRDGVAFVHDLETFATHHRFTYDGEGWGITHDGSRLIMSNGTPTVAFRDPKTFRETGRIEAHLDGRPIGGLNELEYIEGEIWANVWPTDQIVRIDPESGDITGVIDLTGILSAADRRGHRVDVLNGIAYDGGDKRLFVTGKNWPKLFEIRIIPR